MEGRPPLLDVNLLLAYGWKSHPEHAACREWLGNLPKFHTSPITGLGFLRVSMSPAYRANFADVSKMLDRITSMPSAAFLPCDIPAKQTPAVPGYKFVTDAYLVTLAKQHNCRLATLDEGILDAEWGKGIAYRPFQKT
jgi:predicted nucleic acid-binding protein